MAYRIHPAMVICLTFGLFLTSCGISLRTTGVDESGDSAGLPAGALLEQGIASWYGPAFHGRATANGEPYDMEALTAAHRSLPFNTRVRVENLNNGYTVDVRINDRGPYVGNRIIDLSRRAAREIDMIGPGTAEVVIYLLEEGDRPLTPDNTSSRETFTVQLASFISREPAEEKVRRITNSRIEEVPVSGQIVYRVYYGSFETPESARDAMEQLLREGIHGFVKQMEN